MADLGQLSGTIASIKASALIGRVPDVIAAAGSTQGGATAITPGTPALRVTTTTSAEGVKLPSVAAHLAAGGGPLTLIPMATIGFKAYPFAGEGINAVATNTALAVASAKPCTFWPLGGGAPTSALRWAAEKGG